MKLFKIKSGFFFSLQEALVWAPNKEAALDEIAKDMGFETNGAQIEEVTVPNKPTVVGWYQWDAM